MNLFKKAKGNLLRIDTLIGVDTEISGNITGTGNYKIDGSIIGSITVDGDLVISEDASVMGDLSARNIMIEGKVKGNIKASGELVVKDTSEISGEQHQAGRLTVDEGSNFKGNCRITGDMPAKEPSDRS